MLLQMSHMKKSYNGEDIFSDVSLNINENEKVALTGINGSGKSTLLKIITGEEKADDGSFVLKKDINIGYIAQVQEYSSQKTIYEEMLSAKEEVIELENKMILKHEEMAYLEGDELENAIKEEASYRERFESLNGYAYKSEITGVLKGLGFDEIKYDTPVSSLSGGEKTRVALAKMLLNSPELIILDEPTNHLDMNAIRWLEGFLASYRGAVLIVSHDRYFLDKIVDSVVEIYNGESISYKGNYTEFTRKKNEYLESKRRAYAKQQAEIAHEEAVIEKLKQFNREKSIKRAESREKRLEHIERLEDVKDVDSKMNLRFYPGIEGGNDVLSVKELTKAFSDRVLLQDVSFELHKGDRIAVIGENGTGKTTLLKIINDMMDADFGEITLGTDIYIGYYDQAQAVLDDKKTLFDEIHDEYPDMNNTRIRNMLAAFLFKGDDVYKLVGNLSGGEKGRVSLCKLMLSDANFLILDEPTNHLDIDSKEILENALNEYTGTVLFVSHDRYFINRVATGILELSNCDLLKYIGNYDYYIEKKDDVHRAWDTTHADRVENKSAASSSKTSADDFQLHKELKNKRKRLEKRLSETEERIQDYEAHIEKLDIYLNDPANGNDPAGLLKATKESDKYSAMLETAMNEWEEISEELENLE